MGGKWGAEYRPRHRVHGNRRSRSRGIGWEYVHVCIDDATRLAYVEVLEDETAVTAAAFLRRAVAHYRSYGINVERVMTDNGSCYRGVLHAIACRALGRRHLRTRPYRPRTNGKAERFIRTILGGWAYGAIYATPTSESERSQTRSCRRRRPCSHPRRRLAVVRPQAAFPLPVPLWLNDAARSRACADDAAVGVAGRNLRSKISWNLIGRSIRCRATRTPARGCPTSLRLSVACARPGPSVPSPPWQIVDRHRLGDREPPRIDGVRSLGIGSLLGHGRHRILMLLARYHRVLVIA